MKEVKHVFRLMEDNEVILNIVCYNVLINGYRWVGRTARAFTIEEHDQLMNEDQHHHIYYILLGFNPLNLLTLVVI